MSDEDSAELDSLVAENCLRCSGDGSSGKLLVCSVIGCPIAIHEECLCINPQIDGKGRFYCPYCAHKRAVVRAEKLRRKALRAKEVLSMFIDASRTRGEQDALRVKDMDANVRMAKCVQENAGKSLEVAVDEIVVPDSADFQNGALVLRKRRYKQRAQKMAQVRDAIPLRIVDSSSTKSSSFRIDAAEEIAEKLSHKDTSSESRKVSESDHNVKAANPPKKSRKGPELDLNEKDTTSCFESRKAAESNQTVKATTSLSSQSRENPEPNQNEKATTAVPKSRKDPESYQNKNTTTSSTGPIKVPESKSEELNFAKRKRIHWTAEELEMLKEGVRLFSAQVNKNVPWRKILEHGKDVFNETRTPENLKDKWKLLNRELSAKEQT